MGKDGRGGVRGHRGSYESHVQSGKLRDQGKVAGLPEC